MADEIIKVIRIDRFAGDGRYLGGYVQPESEADVILDEIKEAEIGEKWTIVLGEMPKESYENLPEFEGY